MLYIPSKYTVDAEQFDSTKEPSQFPQNVIEENGKYFLSYVENWTDEDTGEKRQHTIKRQIKHGDYVVNDGKRRVVVGKNNFENMHAPLTEGN